MAALIDASTGYNVITDYGDDNLEDPFSAANFDAATGPQPYDDFFESNSAENNLDSGSSLEHPRLLQPIEAIVWDVGATVYRNIYIKTFEDSTAPRLSFSTSFAYLFALILTWIIEFYSTLSFHAANTKSSPRLMLATLSSAGTLLMSSALNRILTAAISFSGTLVHAIHTRLTSVLSFVGSLASHTTISKILTSILSFRSSLSKGWQNLVTYILIVTGDMMDTVLGNASHRSMMQATVSSEQTIGSTATALDFGALSPPLNGLFIKNLDAAHALTIDSDPSFTVNPQLVPPGQAIYLAPYGISTVYGIAAVNIQIQIMTAK